MNGISKFHIAFDSAYILLSLLCSVHILFKKRQPLSALIWVVIVIVLKTDG